MKYRTIGRSGIRASVVGLGTWSISGWMWGGTDEENSIKTIHASIDAGINLIDSAPAYGVGLAEQIVAKAREAAAQERQQMLGELKREVGRLVVKTTTTVTGKILTPEDQRRLAEETEKQLVA